MTIHIYVCLLALVLSCESAQQKLKSLNDLKKIDFGRSVPKHSLLLLHWFANVIDIDNNDVLLLTFDPNEEDFGSHHYGNYEVMLDPLPRGYRYYTVGNLHEDTSDELPAYVLQPPVRECEGTNMDRIIFRVQERSSRPPRIDRVYLTQHYRQDEYQGTRYNPELTYHISPSLLHEMRLFSVEHNPRTLWELRDMFDSDAQDSQLWDLRNIWGHSLACLGLLLFIVIEEKHCKKRPTKNHHQSPSRRTTQADYVVDIPDEMNYDLLYHVEQRDQVQLDVVTGKNGKATIVWRNVPRQRLKEGVAVVMFNHERDHEASSTYKLIKNSEGSYDTSVPLNEGLQVRMHRAERRCLFWTKVKQEICRGKAFKNPDPVLIAGYDAYIQLFVKNGKACVRLIMKKSFTQWRSEFRQSWVGFYDSADKDTAHFKWWKWQWVTKFTQGPDLGDYHTYEYYSSMTIAPGVQARFILGDYRAIARTPPWKHTHH
uniref:Uncharacterized protein n=2 Tax=Periophthalmus magnuspinnatus TaxID=409849 RepID=A0A3B4AYY6_9GOBI